MPSPNTGFVALAAGGSHSLGLKGHAVCRGDANCDYVVSWRDIDYFVVGLAGNESAWRERFAPGTPMCHYLSLDVNGDGSVNWRDINPFVSRMNMTCP